MPHIIVEHSNLGHKFNAASLLSDLHTMAMTIGSLPIGGLRVRAFEPSVYLVGDGDKENDFIYIYVRIGSGRSDVQKQEIGDKLFSVLTAHVAAQPPNKPLSLGLEVQEIDSSLTWKKNNIHKIIEEKNNG